MVFSQLEMHATRVIEEQGCDTGGRKVDISIFEVLGPVMIGPSSSHTAGAARLGAAAHAMYEGTFDRVRFGLHGSFAKTYKGHGTDLALLAGVMGLEPDDERLSKAFEFAGERGLVYEFYEKELEHVHENAVQIDLYRGDTKVFEMIGSSIGGGRILINSLNGCEVAFSAELPTLIVEHHDIKGVISQITGVLAEADLNVGTLRLTRESRGEIAWSIIETDEMIPEQVVMQIEQLAYVIHAQAVQIH